MSANGLQQGHPLGPLIFFQSVHYHCARLKSTFYVMYLHDVTIGGNLEDTLRDLNVIKEAEVLGLTLSCL